MEEENKSSGNAADLRPDGMPVGTPFPPGVSGNPAGMKKGTKSLASIIRELEQDDFNWDKVPYKNKEIRETFKNIGNPFRVIVFVALMKASQGDIHAMEWLRKSGYGDKLDVTTNGKDIQQPPILASTIIPRHVKTETETETSS